VDGENTLLEVVDHGHGIPDNIIDQVFEPFVTTKPPGYGTGLGLSLVYRIIQGHGGHVSIQSDRATGTRVKLYFPSAERPGTEKTSAAAGSG
jgi:signal transduction histidine kinase